MRGIPPAGIVVQVGCVKTRLVLQVKVRRPYAPLRGPGELDRARYKERQADPRAYRQWRRDSREAWVEVGASLLDRRSLRYGHHLRGTRRQSPERPPSGDRLAWQRADHHAPGVRRGRDVGDTPETRLSEPCNPDLWGPLGKPLLLPVVLCYLFEEGVIDLVAAYLPERLTLGEDHTVVLAAGNAVVSFAGLTRTVDNAAHYRDGEVLLEVLEPLFDLSRHPDHIESERASATRTGYDVWSAVPEFEGREDLICHRYLLDGVLG